VAFLSRPVPYLEQENIEYQFVDAVASTTPVDVIISQSAAMGMTTSGIDRLMLTVSVGSTPATSLHPDCTRLATATLLFSAEQTYIQSNCQTSQVHS
jgi:hypothetical protein